MTQPEQQVSYADDWRWSSQAPPPINGQIRTNSTDWSNAVNHLFIANLTDAGVDFSPQLKQIVPGTTLNLAMKTDATRYSRYTATAVPIIQAAYVAVPVTFVTFAGTIPNSSTLVTLTITLPAPAASPITWSVASIKNRVDRYTLTCSCPHGSLSELNATGAGVLPVPPQTTIESTANNLLRKTGCNCAGLVAGTTEIAEEEVIGL